jgi:electron transfer flavoprotein alpha subunit
MASILVWVEHHGGTPVASSLGVLAKGKELASASGHDLVALVVGSGVGDLASSLAAYGASKVLVADDARFASPVAGPYVDALDAAVTATDAALVLLGASVLGAEVGGALAGRRGVGINNDGVDIRHDGGQFVLVRPSLDDSVYVDCTWQNAGGTLQGVALFRSGSFAPATANGGSAAVESLDVSDSGRRAATYDGLEQVDTSGVDITQADVLVGAGRGLQGPEHFALVEHQA